MTALLAILCYPQTGFVPEFTKEKISKQEFKSLRYSVSFIHIYCLLPKRLRVVDSESGNTFSGDRETETVGGKESGPCHLVQILLLIPAPPTPPPLPPQESNTELVLRKKEKMSKSEAYKTLSNACWLEHKIQLS